MKRFLFNIILFVLAVSSISQNVKSVVDKSEDSTFTNSLAQFAETVLDKVTWEKPRYTFAIFPLAGYSERTKFEFGVMPVWRFKPKGSIDTTFYRPTIIAPAFTMSTSGMFEVDIDVSLYTSKKVWVQFKNQYLFLPDLFYGVGNDKDKEVIFSYETYKYFIKGEVSKGFGSSCYLGANFDAGFTNNVNSDKPNLSDLILGYKGGWTNGIGPVFLFDSRDDVSYPLKGIYFKCASAFYADWVLSDYNFNVVNIDARKFLSFGKKSQNVIASQLYLNFVDGDAPYYKMSMLGGKSAVRGVANSQKYIDNNMWMLQTEYRRHLWWRIGVVGFAGVANIYSDRESVFINEHWFAGVGGRFQVMPDEKLNFRIDYGLTNRGDKGIFFTIKEAF